MGRPSRLTVTHKIALSYLLLALFGALAILYALACLGEQTDRTEALVAGDFAALGIARDLRQNLLSQERVERQFLLLKDPALRELLVRRGEEFADNWDRLSRLPLQGGLPDSLHLAVTEYRLILDGELAAPKQPPPGNSEAGKSALIASIDGLIGALDTFLAERGAHIDQSLQELTRRSAEAFHRAIFFALLGLALGTPVALSVIFYIHRSVSGLISATREIAAGSFDYQIGNSSRDEFGQLARAFGEMGIKLRELDQLHLDANPLTRLPGNLAIDQEMSRRLGAGSPFAQVYIDLDNFKAYNDRYGYQAGSDVINRVGRMINSLVKEIGAPDDLVGHVGGDDYVVITTTERAEMLAPGLVEAFDRLAPEFYSAEDRQAGSFVAHDRYGVERQFPLMTISVAVVCTDNLSHPSPEAISRESAKLKKYLKDKPGSNFLFDRRDKR
ncbi:GGDEF domain-containing protein [Desulfuromonas versatilis]|uniref:diguanylate cyclase n=1 Tax=Desulfuromonas versatilis TaxID=2802975 RepID=A0ABM8HU13_9BACT|nr:diguanylate cyclase [Desulfuromonas versatilis]BCR04188.1 GGDEF domain-containing protein [Desulfuromonas versatilis]